MLKHYVEILSPGTVVCYSSVEEIAERDPNKVELTDDCFAFRFFDRTIIVTDGKTRTGSKKNVSGWYYKGEKMTLDQVKAANNTGEYNTLIFNMECDHLDAVVKTDFGKFVELHENDVVI